MDKDLLNKLNNYSLLFIENEKGIRDNFTQYFNLLFKDVFIATDGVDGLNSYRKYNPDLIITDIKMPNMDGIELVKKIREDDSQTLIVIISAHTEVELLLESIPLQLIDYVVKPLNQTKLSEIFEKFLSLKENKDFIYKHNNSETILNGIIYPLSLKENIFLNKIINQNRIITYEEIEIDIWDGKDMSQNALRLFIRDLRKKLPKDFIKNIPNFGYSKS